MTLLQDARAALSTGPLCDSCLGRAFADRSFGLTNAERGRALRMVVAMADDAPYEPPEECWVCEGACERFDEWAERAVAAIEDVEFETYQVGTRVPPLLEENEALLREDVGRDDAGEALNTEFNREVGRRVGERTGARVDFERPDVLVLLDLEADEVQVQVNSAFVYGRYRKLVRGIPQTEWPCRECNGTGRAALGPCEACDGTGYRYDESVEELTTPPVLKRMRGTEAVFHGAGREDVDARMLGTGRPFVIEVKEPRRRSVDAGALEAEIDEHADGTVEVEGLRPATHGMVERVKELDASKTYRMDVEFEAPVDAAAFAAALEELDGTAVEQETPRRVAHRRADRTRERTVYHAEGELVDDHRATLEVHTEGGLYVKELVSGDGGRTEPSLAGLLGVGAEVTALDVLAVEGEDEPFEDPAYFRDGDANENGNAAGA